MHELGVKQFKFSAYHSESQGAIERFQQTRQNTMSLLIQYAEKLWKREDAAKVAITMM